MLLNKKFRSGIVGVFKAFFSPKIMFAYGSLIIYMALVIYALYTIGYWGIDLLKDTLFWLIGFAFILLLNLPKFKRKSDLKSIVKETLKITIIIEYIIAYYTFSYVVELFLIFVLSFLVILIAYSENKEEYAPANRVFKWLLSFIGVFLVCHSIYSMVNDDLSLFQIDNFRGFSLPILLSLLFLPFIYVMALYSTYEKFIKGLPFVIPHDGLRKKIIKESFIIARLDLDKIYYISKNLAYARPIEADTSFQRIKDCSTNKIIY